MPEIVGEPLETEKAKALKAWLKMPEVHILRTVVAAKCRLRQELALKAATLADESNSHDLTATAEMRVAKRYSTFIAVLDEIAMPDQVLQTIKLKL